MSQVQTVPREITRPFRASDTGQRGQADFNALGSLRKTTPLLASLGCWVQGVSLTVSGSYPGLSHAWCPRGDRERQYDIIRSRE